MIRRIPPSAAAPVLVLVLALGFALRQRGVTYGLPLLVNGDELPILGSAMRMLSTGNPDPGFFNYPSLYLYLEALCFGAVYVAGWLAGQFHHLTDLAGNTLPYAGRTLTVVLATFTLLATYLTGRALWGAWTGVLAAALLAVNRLHVANSFVIAVDVAAGLFCALALWAAARRLAGAAGWGPYLVGGACAGLATGSKYTAFLAIAPLVWAHFAAPDGGRIAARLRDPRLYAALGLVPAVFLATTPYALLDLHGFLAGVAIEGHHYATGHPGAESAGGSHAAYLRGLWGGAGPALAMLAAAGTAALLGRAPRTAGLLLAFPVLYLLFIGRFPVHFDRNLVPVLPVLALLGAAGARAAAEALRHGGGKARRGLAVLAAAAAVGLTGWALAGPGRDSLALVREATLPDTRVAAMRWAGAHLPPGARVLREPHTPALELLMLGEKPRLAVTTLEWSVASAPPAQVAAADYLVLSSGMYDRFLAHPQRHPAEAAFYRAVFARYRLAAEFAPEAGRTVGPTIRIYARP